MTGKPTLGLDTSALNRLVKDPNSEPIIAAILAGYSVCLPSMSFEEVIATSEPGLRERLVAICRRLLSAGYCIWPAHWLIDRHVKAFHDNPSQYDWRNVPVADSEFQDEILRGTFANDDTLVSAQAAELRRLQDEFESFFQRPAQANGSPSSFDDWLKVSEQPGGSFWNTARLIYDGAFGSTSTLPAAPALSNPPDEVSLKAFVDACPPMRAFIYALELTLYDRTLRAPKSPAFKAGRNDQMMSVFLPYCEVFLTNDSGQLKSLHEVAGKAGLTVKVKSHDEFCASFIVPTS
jgi:hypothetical protein